jgi:hypothetical protein
VWSHDQLTLSTGGHCWINITNHLCDTGTSLKKNNEKQAIRTVSRQTIVPNTRRNATSSLLATSPPVSYTASTLQSHASTTPDPKHMQHSKKTCIYWPSSIAIIVVESKLLYLAPSCTLLCSRATLGRPVQPRASSWRGNRNGIANTRHRSRM